MHAQATAPESGTHPLPQTRTARVMVLEKSAQMRSWLVAELGLVGHEVLHAATADDAFVAWIGSREPIDLLIMNPITAKGEGLLLWSRLNFLQSGLPVVLPVIPMDVAEMRGAKTSAGKFVVREVERVLCSAPGFVEEAQDHR